MAKLLRGLDAAFDVSALLSVEELKLLAQTVRYFFVPCFFKFSFRFFFCFASCWCVFVCVCPGRPHPISFFLCGNGTITNYYFSIHLVYRALRKDENTESNRLDTTQQVGAPNSPPPLRHSAASPKALVRLFRTVHAFGLSLAALERRCQETAFQPLAHGKFSIFHLE